MSDQEPAKTPESASDAPGSRKRRRWPWVVVLLFVLFVVCVALIPTILSSGPGRSIVVGVVDDAIEGSVKIEGMSLSWFGGQEIRGVALHDPEGDRVASIDFVKTDLSIWKAIRSDLNLGATELSGVDAKIIRGEDGQTNLQRAIAMRNPKPESDEPAKLPDTLRGQFKVSAVKAQVSGSGIEKPVSIDLDGTLAMPGAGQPIAIDIKANAKQGDVSGKLAVAGTVENATAADGTLTVNKVVPKLTVTASDLPSDGLDALLGQQGRLAAAMGATLNAEVKTDGTPEELRLTLVVTSPNVNADAAALLKAGKALALTKPATVRLVATPELVDALLAPGEEVAALALAKTVPVVLTAEKLDLTFADTSAAAIIARVNTEQPITLAGDERIGEVVVSNLAIDIDTAKLGESAKFSANADLMAGGQPGKVAVRGTVDKPLDEATRSVDITADLANLPVALADRIASQDGLLVDALGPNLNLTATAKTGESRRVDMSLAAKSANLDANIAGHLKGDFTQISLADSTANLKLVPALLKRYMGEDGLVGPSTATLKITRFDMPIGEKASLDDVVLAVAAELVPQDANDKVAAALGPKLAVNLETQPVSGNARPIKLAVRSAALNGDVPLTLVQEGETISLSNDGPGNLRLVVSDALLALAGREPMFAGPTPVELSIEKLRATAVPFAMGSVELRAGAKFTKLELTGDGALGGAAVSDADATLVFDGPKKVASLTLDGKASAPGQSGSGPIKLDAAIANLIDAKGAINAADADIEVKSLELKNFPTAFVDATVNQDGKLVALAGDTMDISATGKLKGGKGDAKAKITAPRLSGDADLKIGDYLELNKPLAAKAQITPESYAALTKPKDPPAADAPQPMQLSKPFTVDATVQKLRWPRGETFDPAGAVVDALITATRIELMDPKTKQAVVIDSLKATAAAPNLSQPLVIKVAGEIPTATGAGGGAPGVIAVNATVTELYKEGAVDTEGMSIDLTADLKGFPVALIDSLKEFNGVLVAALGPGLDLTADAKLKQMQGPVNLSAKATNATLSVRSMLGEEWVTLSEPILADLKVTRELSDKVFSRLSPVLKGVRKSEPVTLTVTNEGFRIPRTFDIKQMAIPAAVLELGEVTLENDKVMKGLLALLRSNGGDTIPAVFTPAIVKVADGKLVFSRRLDMLLDKTLHIATWGEADLTVADATQSRYTQVLAIAPRSLANVYKIDGLSENDFLRIPVRGTSGKPEVDYSQAVADMGKLEAQARLAKVNPLAGNLLRGLMKDLFAGPPVPKASVDPLPWTTAVPESQTAEAPKQAKPREPEKSTEEKLIEGALDLLNRRKKK